MTHLWDWFWSIIGGMGEAGFWVTLDAWCRRTGNELDFWEVDLMSRMHSAYNKAVSDQLRKR